MSKAKSAEEAMLPMDRMDQAKGSPDMKQYSVESTLPEGMKNPSAPGEQAMGGVCKGMSGGGEQNSHMGNSDMGSAIKQLNYETERGSHAPSVAGDKSAGMHHQGIMTKD